jgi:hypothetical protein
MLALDALVAGFQFRLQWIVTIGALVSDLPFPGCRGTA